MVDDAVRAVMAMVGGCVGHKVWPHRKMAGSEWGPRRNRYECSFSVSKQIIRRGLVSLRLRQSTAICSNLPAL